MNSQLHTYPFQSYQTTNQGAHRVCFCINPAQWDKLCQISTKEQSAEQQLQRLFNLAIEAVNIVFYDRSPLEGTKGIIKPRSNDL